MEHRKGKTIMKTTRELQEEKRELEQAQNKLERQIRLAKEREEKAKKDKAIRGEIKAQEQAQLNITPQVKEIIKEQREQRELKRQLKEELNISSLYTQQDYFRVKVERATTQEQRRLLRKRFYTYDIWNIEKGLGIEELTQEQKEIIIAKQGVRRTLKEEESYNKRNQLKEEIKAIIKDIKYIGYDFNNNNEWRTERVITYLKKFMLEEQALIKMKELVKPHRAKALQEQITREEEDITRARKNIAKLKAQLGEF